jgi:hypothetical protein
MHWKSAEASPYQQQNLRFLVHWALFIQQHEN